MSEIPTILRELHRMHVQLGDLRDRYNRGPKQIQAREANVAKLEADLTAAKAAVKQARMSADQKELMLKSSENKILDLTNKLNVCKSNREYQALLEQIAADKMAGSVLSDEILEVLEKVDQLKNEVLAAEQKLALAKTELGQARDKVAAEAGNLQGDIQRIEKELSESERRLPADAREAYERVVRSRGFDGMSGVEGESCGGCCQQLTPNQMSTLILGQMVFCHTCGRLLYLPEDRQMKRR